MDLKLEKILTVSASEYCEAVGLSLADYTMKCVMGRPDNIEVPKGTEVVVGYQLYFDHTGGQQHSSGIGTALIRKRRKA